MKDKYDRDMKHPSEAVERAMITLCDALCEWERATGIESVLVFRESSGLHLRAVNGKPSVPFLVPDSAVLEMVDKAALKGKEGEEEKSS